MRIATASRLAIVWSILFLLCGPLAADDGYRLWLRYDAIDDAALLASYRNTVTEILIQGDSPTMAVVRDELVRGLTGLLGSEPPRVPTVTRDGALIVGTPSASPVIAGMNPGAELGQAGDEGYVIRSVSVAGKRCTMITANHDIGVLYGAFAFLRLLETHRDIADLSILSAPRVKIRMLDHWDNLDRTVERGYAGFSLWDWHKLPDYLSPRYTDYARANASIGINGAALNNVNANSLSLTHEYLVKAAALADVFRPYGIHVYLSIKFSAPSQIGGLETADPLDPAVAAWWKDKASEIYDLIPDFGGFLVKANSEGQPGPQDYGRTHADGANMLADALAPHGGVVIWRAFVYSNETPEDRAKQAYNEFTPLDGTFRKNVFVQVKNGPIDFQPREPFHPLFGAMPGTPLMMEFQITKEYLGQATHLVYLAPLFKEVLEADTYAKGPGSTVAKVIDGTLEGHQMTGIAGVANTGTDRDWTGGVFNQANWYAFGRLAWDHTLTSEEIADEWIRMTFSNDESFIAPVKSMMMTSREAVVDYMTPLGLHHIMAAGHHWGPGPWFDKGRADWTPVYYHRADAEGIGFDRSSTGSDAVSQYFPPVASRFNNLETCPEEYLLWFHHVSWDHKMKSGRTLWDELCYRYQKGVDEVRHMQTVWDSLEGKVDRERFRQVKAFLKIQEKEAEWWRDACLLYFQTFSKRPLPPGVEKPAATLEEFEKAGHPIESQH
jgi:alpha-glucuronidase